MGDVRSWMFENFANLPLSWKMMFAGFIFYSYYRQKKILSNDNIKLGYSSL